MVSELLVLTRFARHNTGKRASGLIVATPFATAQNSMTPHTANDLDSCTPLKSCRLYFFHTCNTSAGELCDTRCNMSKMMEPTRAEPILHARVEWPLGNLHPTSISTSDGSRSDTASSEACQKISVAV